MKRRVVTLLAISILLISISTLLIYTLQVTSPTICRRIELPDLPAGVHVEIRPEMELLAGVLSQTSWMDVCGPHGEGNEYFRDLKDFFSAYRDHEAVRIAEDLTQRGFSYDAPPGFILSLGPLPELAVLNGYSEYLQGRAGGNDVLEQFRIELSNLARESGFIDFFETRRSYLENLLADCGQDFHGTEVIQWLHRFFGTEGDEYFLVFAPAFPRDGGYGFTHTGTTGRKSVYEIVREDGIGTGRPEFPNGRSLERLTFHEWGHSFVNPAVEAVINNYQDMKLLYAPVRRQMYSMAYGQPQVFFNEQILRAATLFREAELYGKEAYESSLAKEELQGFYLSAFTVEQLRTYERERASYPAFTDFLPKLFEAYRSQLSELLALVPADTVPELKDIRVRRILRSGDTEISQLRPPLPNSFLLDVTFMPAEPAADDQIGEFLMKAGYEFDLMAEGAPIVAAGIYRGDRFTTTAGTFWGFWLEVTGDAALTTGVQYRLVPRKPDPVYRWLIGDDITITLQGG